MKNYKIFALSIFALCLSAVLIAPAATAYVTPKNTPRIRFVDANGDGYAEKVVVSKVTGGEYVVSLKKPVRLR